MYMQTAGVSSDTILKATRPCENSFRCAASWRLYRSIEVNAYLSLRKPTTYNVSNAVTVDKNYVYISSTLTRPTGNVTSLQRNKATI